ncbi:MAG: glycoside hydrolase family 3 N-terminal domain-containing protein [Gaiellales bacterium]
MNGTSANATLLQTVREGRVGSVILFGANITGRAQLEALTGSLQHAARQGGNPPLLIAVDQEGGEVRRIRWAPPAQPASRMSALGAATACAQGEATGRALRVLGVNTDLAPVMDVPAAPRSFIQASGRAWGGSAAAVARTAAAFAAGLGRTGTFATAKHFPGLGAAAASTDVAQVAIREPVGRIESGMAPFRTAIRDGVPLVMLSTARYPNLAADPAAWSPRIIGGLLRGRLGFHGVTITDSLDAAARVRGTSLALLAVRSARAGADLLLVTGGGTAWARAYAGLLAAAGSGRLSHADLETSYRRILSLKSRIRSDGGQPNVSSTLPNLPGRCR